MKTKFKIGDKVKCIDCYGTFLTPNKIYTVSRVYGTHCETHLDLDGEEFGFRISRFELVKEEETIKLNTPEEQLELIKAENEGKTIEFRLVNITDMKWAINQAKGVWHFDRAVYRIKPVVKKKVKHSIKQYVILKDNEQVGYCINDLGAANAQAAYIGGRVIPLTGHYYTEEEV